MNLLLVQNSPLNTILSWFHPPPILTTCLSKVYLNVILPPFLDHPSGHFPRSFSTRILYTFLVYLPQPSHMPSPS
jgi:hypothetical protein